MPAKVQTAWTRVRGVGRTYRQLLQRRNRRLVGTLHQQLLGSVAPPAIGVRQMRHQLCRRLVDHVRLGAGRLYAGVDDAIDAALVNAVPKPVLQDIVFQIVGLDRFVLGHAAIHVHDIDAAVPSLA
jgi:hypothetical protein